MHENILPFGFIFFINHLYFWVVSASIKRTDPKKWTKKHLKRQSDMCGLALKV